MRCTVCQNPQVNEVDVLLASGGSIRQVARMYSIPRSNLARHRQHIAPATRPFGVIPGGDGPPGPPDPLGEALALAERARTPRERLRAAEQVRGATRLLLRGIQDPDADHQGLLDSNIAKAEELYRGSPDFETQARALSGWRAAIIERLDVVRPPDTIDVPFTISVGDGPPSPGSKPVTWPMRPQDYWKGIPQRYRDLERFAVHRVIRLAFAHGSDPAPESDLKVYDRASGALVWAK